MAVKISSKSSTPLSEIKAGDFVTFHRHRHRNVYYVNCIYFSNSGEARAAITKFSNDLVDVAFDFLMKYEDVPVEDLVKFVGTITIECT